MLIVSYRSKKILKILAFIIFYLGLFFIYTRNDFLSPHDDAKALFFYLYSWIVVFLSSYFMLQKEGFKIDKLYFLLIVSYVFYGLVNLLVNGFFYEGFVQLAEIIIFILLIFFFSHQDLSFLLKLLKATIFILPLLFLYSIYFSYLVKGTVISPIGHISFFGNIFLFFIPWIIYFLIKVEDKRKIVLIIFFISFLISNLAVFLTLRRAHVLGLIVCYLILFFLNFKLNFKNSNKQIFIFFGLSILIFVLTNSIDKPLTSGPKNMVTRVGNIINNGLDKSDRLKMNFTVLKSLENNLLLGHGYGTFKFLYTKFYDADFKLKETEIFSSKPQWLTHPHNILTFYLFEAGLIGALFILIFFFLTIFRTIKLIFYNLVVDDKKILLIFAVSSLSGLVICLNVDTSSESVVMRGILILNLAVIFNILREYYQLIHLKSFFEIRSKISRIGFLILIYSLMTISSGIAINNYLTSYNIAQGLKNFRFPERGEKYAQFVEKYSLPTYNTLYFLGYTHYRNRNYPEAQNYLSKTYQKYPYVPVVHKMLAKTYLRQRKIDLFKSIIDRSLKVFPHYQEMIDLKERYYQ